MRIEDRGSRIEYVETESMTDTKTKFWFSKVQIARQDSSKVLQSIFQLLSQISREHQSLESYFRTSEMGKLVFRCVHVDLQSSEAFGGVLGSAILREVIQYLIYIRGQLPGVYQELLWRFQVPTWNLIPTLALPKTDSISNQDWVKSVQNGISKLDQICLSEGFCGMNLEEPKWGHDFWLAHTTSKVVFASDHGPGQDQDKMASFGLGLDHFYANVRRHSFQ